MRVLLDTNIVSEIRRAGADLRVVERVRSLRPQDTFLSVITVGELVYGAKRLAAGKKRREIETWLTVLQQTYAERILPIDADIARAWGALAAAHEAVGRSLHPQDGLIAATAARHDLHLMTRNVAHFERTGVPLINPWDG